MDKVYVVTSGSYSDYGIDAVFSTREKAEEYVQVKCTFIKKYKYDHEIEEYQIDSTPDELYICGFYYVKENRIDIRWINEPNLNMLFGTDDEPMFRFSIKYHERLKDEKVLLKAVQDLYAQTKWEKENG